MATDTTETAVSETSVGAASRQPDDWHQINWCQAERQVRRLQTRIAQATQAGKWGKVKALQRLLTHSRERQSVGCPTSDGKHWTPHAWRRWGNLEHARAKDDSASHPASTGIPASPVAAGLHPQKQWRHAASPLDSHHAGPRHAGSVPAGS
jgi:hypothetical protein